MTADEILQLERPHPRLMTYYFIRCLVFPPFSLIALPVMYFRYHTMRYRFDEEGISMSWGILFRKEVNLTYARIQDIHLTSGIIQRWMGLADVHIQTASGSAQAEMKIEGILEYEAMRDFLYTRMRGYRERSRMPQRSAPITPTGIVSTGDGELAAILREIQTELRLVREAVTAGSVAQNRRPE